MNTTIKFLPLILSLAPVLTMQVAQAAQIPVKRFADARSSIDEQLKSSIEELATLRGTIAKEQIPLNKELNQLQSELVVLRQDLSAADRELATRSLGISKEQTAAKQRKEELSYIGSQLTQFADNFEARLHIAELGRYEDVLDATKMAVDNPGWTEAQVLLEQAGLVTAGFNRLEGGLGCERFDGSAVDSDGIVSKGTFLIAGPAVLFLAEDGTSVGIVEERLGSLAPSVIPYKMPEQGEAAEQLVRKGMGEFYLDPTLGDAHKVQATKTTLMDEVRAGGTVMIPIFVMAGLALLVSIWKWIRLALVRKPSKRRVSALLEHVANRESDEAMKAAQAIGGPVGQMLVAGVDHLGEPPELIEEVMYEKALTTKMKLQSMLPFVAICAASAPLLGLLGTVTGIIQTFELITVFGSGDVKTLSGGISEALITTKFGLIVAIPALLLHAFLSRKAKGIVGVMERSAVAFTNEVTKASPHKSGTLHPTYMPQPDAREVHPDSVRNQVTQILQDLLGPLEREASNGVPEKLAPVPSTPSDLDN